MGSGYVGLAYAAPVGFVECEAAGARSAMLRCAPAGPPSVCSLRFAPVRARGDTDGGPREVALSASGGHRGRVVEVNGGYHRQRATADARRTQVLERLGYRVLRLDAELVSRQLPLAVEVIRNAVQVICAQGAP